MTTTRGELHAMAVKAVDDFRRKAILVLQKAGEEAVNEARSAGDWKDQTGNLRSSIGYVVSENGSPIVLGKFDKVKDTASSGPATGSVLAAKLASETPGLALIVVAGMNYAKYVADKGYNVLSSSQILAEMRIPELFEGMARYNENR